MSQQYPLSVHSWGSTQPPILVRCRVSNELIATFPLDFVQHGGDNTWRYILNAVRQLIVIEQDEKEGSWIAVRDGAAVDLDSEVRGGEYWYHQSGEAVPVKMVFGPEYFRSRVPPSAEGSDSTRSDSKRSSEHQSRFREYLIARDCECLVTDEVFTGCTPSHIVPASRPDLYQRILDIPYAPPMFHPSVGLLLRDDLHHAYDRLQWSLYHKDGTFYVHIFVLNDPKAAKLHGKALRPERSRGEQEWRPDVRLTSWHYNQCLMAHIRGYAVGYEQVGNVD